MVKPLAAGVVAVVMTNPDSQPVSVGITVGAVGLPSAIESATCGNTAPVPVRVPLPLRCFSHIRRWCCGSSRAAANGPRPW